MLQNYHHDFQNDFNRNLISCKFLWQKQIIHLTHCKAWICFLSIVQTYSKCTSFEYLVRSKKYQLSWQKMCLLNTLIQSVMCF